MNLKNEMIQRIESIAAIKNVKFQCMPEQRARNEMTLHCQLVEGTMMSLDFMVKREKESGPLIIRFRTWFTRNWTEINKQSTREGAMMAIVFHVNHLSEIGEFKRAADRAIKFGF